MEKCIYDELIQDSSESTITEQNVSTVLHLNNEGGLWTNLNQNKNQKLNETTTTKVNKKISFSLRLNARSLCHL